MSVVSFPQTTPFLVVFGRDQAGKPHASWFDQASAELATKAASLMNMKAVPVEGDELRELAGTLPKGRVFSSGKAFTPFVNGKLYGRLVELTRDLLGLSQAEASDEGEDERRKRQERFVGRSEDLIISPADEEVTEAPGKGRGEGQSSRKPSSRPTRREEVGLGSIVLATTGPTEGWFETEVIGINGTMLTLKWCDYNEPTVVRRLHEIGFLPALQHG